MKLEPKKQKNVCVILIFTSSEHKMFVSDSVHGTLLVCSYTGIKKIEAKLQSERKSISDYLETLK